MGYGGVRGGVLAILIAFFAGSWRPVPETTEIDTDGRVAALVQSQLALATDSLSRAEFESALAYADAALTVAPDEAEALRIRAAAQAALAREASEPSAALEPLAADPPQVADPSPRTVPPPPPPPPQPRRPDSPPPEDIRPAPPPVETPTAPASAPAPATRALEPTTEDDRVAEVDEATPPAQAETEPPLANAVDEGEPGTSTLAREADVPPTPANVPGSQRDVPISQREDAAVREVLATLERAIETMDMTLYRSVRPTLSGDEERRVRAGFDAVQSQQVDLRILSIDVQGNQAVVRVARRDTIQTGGGEQTQESNQTVTLAKASEGWVITQMGG